MISYGVYLIHPLLIPVFGILIRDHINDGHWGATLLFAVVLPATLILADLCYRFVEKPANDWLRVNLLGEGQSTSSGPKAKPSA